MIGREAEEVLNRAVRYAFERRQEYFTLEHVLLSLLEEPKILEIIQACGGSYTAMMKELEQYLDKEVPKASSALEKEEGENESVEQLVEHPVATLGIQRMIQRAIFHVQSAGKEEVTPEDLFIAMFQAKDSFSVHLLAKQGIQRLDVLNYVSHGVAPGEDANTRASQSSEREDDDEGASGGNGAQPGGRRAGGDADALGTYAVNLNTIARKGKIDPLVGRDVELDRMIRTLCRRRKNNPLLVGEAGVGKTALAEGLALRIVQGQVPHILKNAEVYSLDIGTILAGAKFRGDFEQRIKRVLNALQKKKDSGLTPILFIDEIHTIIGAGTVAGSSLDAANLLKPVLTRGEIQCIGSTTYNEYRTIFEKDHALARRFQKIDVAEPSKEEAVQILKGLRSKFEDHHHVSYSDDAIESAVELSQKHITDRFLPDKAIDVIDEAGAKSRLSRSPEDRSTLAIGAKEIEEVIAQIARIPARTVNVSQKARLKNLERDLRLTIYGQDQAIEALTTAIRLARSGLRSGERPIGSFLFCGPTGVGKTELSKQLARLMGVPFLRYDMSEYMEKHTVSRLIGAPPGYVGFEQAGLLTDAIIKNPHAVVLLDEIEKAHPDINNILLQVMDYGVLTDNNGRKADFRNAIIIMTSNVGSRELDRNPLGMANRAPTESVSKKEIERAFSPEFRNRLDAIVYFNALDPVTIAQVVGKQLMELEAQLLAKHVELEVDEDVRDWLARHGYDRNLGARPMGRLIQDRIKKPLAEEILFGQLEFGGRVHVSIIREKGEENLHFEFEPRRRPEGAEVEVGPSEGLAD